MERETREAVRAALVDAFGEQIASETPVDLEVPREKTHGDWATTVALSLARVLGRPPRELAAALASRLETRTDLFDSVEVAGPGFLNFRIGRERLCAGLREILAAGPAWGRSPRREGPPVMVEYVSANPTGPLNVVSARAAAFGGTLTRLLAAAGHDAVSEFYVNDVGRQIDLLGETLLARYRQVHGEPDAPLPEEGYQGDYVAELARGLDRERTDLLLAQSPEGEAVAALARHAVEAIRSGQQRDLEAYGTRFDRWFRQHELYPERVEATRARLEELGLTEEREGAVWFRSTRFGDDQDRVLVRANREPTYFLADLAYHADKHERGIGHSIDIWGPDHHGYIGRMQAGCRALGFGEDWLEVLVVQQVNLVSGGEPVKMSKRKGEFITLEDLIAEVGKETAIFFFLQRRAESHLDFDLDLARKQSEENPVFYVKYAHARIAGVLRKAAEAGVELPGAPDVSALGEEPEIDLIKFLVRFPGVVAAAAEHREPHRVTNYLREVAQSFHVFYHHCRVVGEEARVTEGRLALCRGAQLVLANGLALMDIEAPERM